MSTKMQTLGSLRATLLTKTITTAATTISDIVVGLVGTLYLVVQAKFTYGSGGTNATAYIQTSLDAGVTWIDIMCFQFATTTATKVSAVVSTTALAAAVTPTDGAITVNTILSGLLGDRFRVKLVTTGTYADSTVIAIDMNAKG